MSLHPHAGFLARAAMIVLCGATLAIVIRAGDGSGAQAPARDAGLPDEPAQPWPVRLTISNPYDRSFSPALVQGGVPFARGTLHDATRLQVDAPGAPAPISQARPLAFWPDGSVRWAEVTFSLPQIAPHATTSVGLRLADPAPPAPSAPASPPLPDGLRLELLDDLGSTEFVAGPAASVATGPACDESIVAGVLRDREHRTSASISVTRFPSTGALRLRVTIKQLTNGAVWKRLALTIPCSSASVLHADELDAATAPTADGRVEATLIRRDQPVDRGTGRTWEIWAYEQRDAGQPRPLRPVPDPGYISATEALGRIVATPPPDWQRAFNENVERLAAKRQDEPRNSGWMNFGAFFDRAHGLAYYGYLNAEYDPASCLWMAYARSGTPRVADLAEALSAHFRDLNVAPDGGVYEHRATWNAADARVIAVIAPNLERKLASSPAYAPSPRGLRDAIEALYGAPAARATERSLASAGNAPFPEQQRLAVDRLAGELIKQAREQTLRGLGRLSTDEQNQFPIARLYRAYAARPDLAALGFRDADAAFAPFFQRYGGSWRDFPAFHADIHPDPAVRHGGGHALVEMLVTAYLFTGDEGHRAAALAVAAHHLDDLVPRMIRRYEPQIAAGAPIDSRDLAWPLINLLSVHDLAIGRDDALAPRIAGQIDRLAALLIRVPVDAHSGSVHAGLALEALCRYHERSNSRPAADSIVALARRWASTQWNQARRAFNTSRDNGATASVPMNGLLLYGLAYAHDLAPDPALRRRVLEAYGSLTAVRTSYAKEFAQLYRAAPRALAIIDRWKD